MMQFNQELANRAVPDEMALILDRLQEIHAQKVRDFPRNGGIPLGRSKTAKWQIRWSGSRDPNIQAVEQWKKEIILNNSQNPGLKDEVEKWNPCGIHGLFCKIPV
jgi:hypothetical protein